MYFVQVNYFPSRFDPVRHAERYPYPNTYVSGLREKRIIEKENNFKQPGDRFRSWDPARQERFIGRIGGMLAHPKCTQVWTNPVHLLPAPQARGPCAGRARLSTCLAVRPLPCSMRGAWVSMPSSRDLWFSLLPKWNAIKHVQCAPSE